jgi:tetratricopeptide (TPR) repeat protein
MPQAAVLEPQALVGTKSPAQLLARANESRLLVQDFTRFPQSLEWELGQAYLSAAGTTGFVRDHIPHAINNDGTLSQSAAEVLFQSLLAADESGTLEPDIYVLELGIGIGLFARYLLHELRQRCAATGKDYYDRLQYVAGDYSGRMLLDGCRNGVFRDHPGRYLLRTVDALDPAAGLRADPVLGGVERPFRAVFLNYVLDCLPATVIRGQGTGDREQGISELYVRTCLARGLNLGEYTDYRPEELAEKAHSGNAAERRQLLDVFGLLTAEYEMRPGDLGAIPYGAFALDFARSVGCEKVWHSYGAIQCLERLLPLLREDGFILINDYGHTDPRAGEDFEHQRMSRSTFIGINFPEVKAFFTGREQGTGDREQTDETVPCSLSPTPYVWAEPAEDTGSIYPRLLGHRPAERTVECFRQVFSKEAYEERQEPVEVARACLQAGAVDAALTAYQKALERQPLNWLLLSEVAKFLTFTLKAPEAGLALARAAVELNPACSAELWNTCGDSLFVLGRHAEARQAFERALKINPNDARAWYNLAFVYQQMNERGAALEAIAKGLLLDGPGEFRKQLFEKQAEIVGQVEARWRQEQMMQANRVNRYRKPPRRQGELTIDN